MTSSNGNIFRVIGHLCGKFTGSRWIPAQRPVTRSFDVFFDLRLNKRFSKQQWGCWFETLLRPLWRYRNASVQPVSIISSIRWHVRFSVYIRIYDTYVLKIQEVYSNKSYGHILGMNNDIRNYLNHAEIIPSKNYEKLFITDGFAASYCRMYKYNWNNHLQWYWHRDDSRLASTQ